jgi:hypothetical protein
VEQFGKNVYYPAVFGGFSARDRLVIGRLAHNPHLLGDGMEQVDGVVGQQGG